MSVWSEPGHNTAPYYTEEHNTAKHNATRHNTRQDTTGILESRKHACGQVPLLGAPVPPVPGKPRMGATYRTGANRGQQGDHNGRPQAETTSRDHRLRIQDLRMQDRVNHPRRPQGEPTRGEHKRRRQGETMDYGFRIRLSTPREDHKERPQGQSTSYRFRIRLSTPRGDHKGRPQGETTGYGFKIQQKHNTKQIQHNAAQYNAPQNKTRHGRNPRKHAWGQVPLLGAPVPLVPGKPRMSVRSGLDPPARETTKRDHKGKPQGENTREQPHGGTTG